MVLLPLSAQALSIKQVYHEYKEGDDFRRITEYFTGRENQGRRVITRSQPSEYGGYYFVVITDKSINKLPPDSQIEVAVILPNAPEPEVYTLTIPQKQSRLCEVYAGITGSDWPDPLQMPIAWCIKVQDTQGNELARRHSFLWNDD